MIAEPASERLQLELEMQLAIALAGGARLAVAEEPDVRVDIMSLFRTGVAEAENVQRRVFVMLMPGEKPPPGRVWTIYEHTANGWRGRSA